MNVAEPTVHIVDDDAPFSRRSRGCCARAGLPVKTFGSASDFLAQRIEDAPGCVLADVRMPGMNGLELQSALAQSSIRCRFSSSPATATFPRAFARCAMGRKTFSEKRAAKDGAARGGDARARSRRARARRRATRQRELRARFARSPHGSSKCSAMSCGASSTSRSPAISASTSGP